MVNSYTDTEGTYKNKWGITDATELRLAEYASTSVYTEEILSGKINLGVPNFGLERLQAIHRHIFQDVYEWAGKIRTVPSSKRMENGLVSVFANPDRIVRDWGMLELQTDAFVKAQGQSFEQKREALVDIFIEANRIHPFPEGNGRSLQIFMRQLAHTQGIELDYSKVQPREWNLASGLSGVHGRLFERRELIPHYRNSEPIRKIFADMASPSQELEQAKSPISVFRHIMAKQPPLHQLSSLQFQQLALDWKQTLEQTRLEQHPAQDRQDIQHYTKALIEEGASRNWPEHREILRQDSRYRHHSTEELTKVAYCRAIREQASFFGGEQVNWERFDSVMSGREVLEKLQDISGLEELAGQGREETHSQETGEERDSQGQDNEGLSL